MHPDERRFIEVFRRCAVQAGHVARHLQGRVAVEHKAGESSPEAAAITAVDLATQDVILTALAEEFPGIAVDAEEDTELARSFSSAPADASLVVLDPVDGTLNYTRGSSDYAVMGVLVRQHRYRAALIHFPAHAETYWAVTGEGCTVLRAGEGPQRVRVGNPDGRVFVTPDVPEAWHDRLRAFGPEVAVSRCSAVCASALATGRARASVSPTRADRRRAIGFLLTTEAGGAVRLGARAWAGEDPDTLPADAGPSICAESPAIATRMYEALVRA